MAVAEQRTVRLLASTGTVVGAGPVKTVNVMTSKAQGPTGTYAQVLQATGTISPAGAFPTWYVGTTGVTGSTGPFAGLPNVFVSGYNGPG